MTFQIATKALIALLALVCMSLPAAFADTSGMYLAQSDYDVQFVQIVEVENGEITARAEFFSIDKNGKLQSQSVNLKGVTSERQLILTPDNVFTGLGLVPSTTGQLVGGDLILALESGDLRLRPTTLQKRNIAINALSKTAEHVAKAIKTENMNTALLEAKHSVQALENDLETTIIWLSETSVTFETRLDEARSLSRQISTFVTTDDNWHQKNDLIDQYHALDSELMDIEDLVRRRRAQLNQSTAKAQEKIDEVRTFCTINPNLDLDADFCSEIENVQSRIDTFVAAMRPQFQAWDALQPANSQNVSGQPN